SRLNRKYPSIPRATRVSRSDRGIRLSFTRYLAGFLAAFGSGRASVRASVIAIVAITLAPALVVAGSLAISSAVAQRTELEQSAHNQVRAVAAAIDREVLSIQRMLTALSTTRSLQSGDFAAFYPQAVEASRRLNVLIVVRDLNLNLQVIN